jgi:predicted ribosomally synthesized peptide with SipW-like signal peptide
MKSKMVAAFALVMIALMVAGFAYAAWSETLTVSGTVKTGSVDAKFDKAMSNNGDDWEDPPPPEGKLDPCELGTWTNWNKWSGNRYAYDVAETKVEISRDGKTLTITIENAYPGYYPGVGFLVKNTGDVPIKFSSISITGDTSVLDIKYGGPVFSEVIEKGKTEWGYIAIKVTDNAVEGATYTFTVTIEFKLWTLVP